MKTLLNVTVMIGSIGALSADARAAGKTATTSPLVSGNSTIVDNEIGGTVDDFGDVGPTSDGDPDDNPFTGHDWEYKLFDDPDYAGMQFVVVDATFYSDIIHVEWTENGMLRIYGDSTVNGGFVAYFSEIFDPRQISRINIYALEGSDIIDNQTEVTLYAFGGDSSDYIHTGYGSALVWAGPGDDFVTMANGTRSTVYGEAGDDTIIGSDGNDRLLGGSGSDSIDGRGGNDRIFGDTGAFSAGPSDSGYNDVLRGGEGNDLIWGGTGADEIHGGPGDDNLDGYGRFLKPQPRWPENPYETDDEIQDTIYGDTGADVFRCHDWRLFSLGFTDYPKDYNSREGDVLDIEVHTDYTPW